MNKRRFPANDIISLIGAAPRYELGESVGPDTRLEELFDDSSTKGLQDRGRKRAFRTASSGRGPRQQIARSSADRGSWHKPGLSAELLAALRLGYATPAGDPRLRAAIAQRHGVAPDDVVVTVGGMHALFLIAFLLCDDTAEAVGSAPMFPLARNVLEAVERASTR